VKGLRSLLFFGLVGVLMVASLAELSRSAELLDDDNDTHGTRYVGGRDQGMWVRETLTTVPDRPVVYLARQAVSSPSEGCLFVLISVAGVPGLEGYVFARPSDRYIEEHPEEPSYVKLFGKRGMNLATGVPVSDFLQYRHVCGAFDSQSPDILFQMGTLEGFEGTTVSLETAVYREDTKTFQVVQAVFLDVVGGPVCGDGLCESPESEEDFYCADDCCGDGVCSPGEESLCSEDCYSRLDCSSCPYGIEVPSLYDYECTEECPGYRMENGKLVQYLPFERIEHINSGFSPVSVLDPGPYALDYVYLPTGGYTGDLSWPSPPEGTLLLKFVLPERIRLDPGGNGGGASFPLSFWNFYMGTSVLSGTGVTDLIIRHAGPLCEEPPPDLADYREVRDKVWASECPDPRGFCAGKLEGESVWYEVGYHVPTATASVGSGFELGNASQNILVEENDPEPGCYYALMVNWSLVEADPPVRIRTTGSWKKEP